MVKCKECGATHSYNSVIGYNKCTICGATMFIGTVGNYEIELVGVADPIFEEGDEFVESKPKTVTPKQVESYIDTRGFTGNICDFMI